MLDQVADLIREVAARVVLPRFRRLREGEVHLKSPGDAVTIDASYVRDRVEDLSKNADLSRFIL